MEVQTGWCRYDLWRHGARGCCVKSDCVALGSECGLKLGRQAAWRPGTIGMVSSSLLAALCKQLLCLKVIARSWALAKTRSSSCLAAGYNRDGVVKFVGGTQAVAVFKGNCEVLGLWLRAHTRSSSCLAAGYIRVDVVKFVGGTVQAVAVFEGNCEVLGLWLRAHTRSSSCLAAGYIRVGVVKIFGGTVQAVAVFKSNCEVLGLWLRAQIRSSSCLAAGYNRDGVVRLVGDTQQISCRSRVCCSCWSSGFTAGPFRCPRGRCSPVQKLCSSSEDSNDGKELLRHQRQSKRMEYTVLANVVHLSARLMFDAADGFLCDEEPQWCTAGVCRSRTTRQDRHVASLQDTMFFSFWVKTHT